MPLGGLFSRSSGTDPAGGRSEGHSGKNFDHTEDAGCRLELFEAYEDAGIGWFWATDADGRLTYLSEIARRVSGWADVDVIGKPLADLIATDAVGPQPGRIRPLAFLLSARNSIADLPVRVKGADKETYWELAGKPFYDKDGNFAGYRGSARDITAIREKQREAERMEKFDPVTGLANRHNITSQLDEILKQYRNAKRSCALMIVNLDRFRNVSELQGEVVCEDLLKQVAARLEKLIGRKGPLGHLGGGEFHVVLPDLDDRGELGDLASRVIQALSQPYAINEERTVIGASVGLAIAPYDGVTCEEVVEAGKLALQMAKREGRGQYRFYSSDLQETAKQSGQLESELREAFEKRQLAMHYQPIVDAGSDQVAGFEALMRWEHPEKGSISPADFIPIAEETDLIRPLGKWALEQVCADAAAWPAPLNVAINISIVQFADDAFPALVKQVLERTGLAAERLELEITESVFLGDTGRAQRVFDELKRLGVGLVLDDFGTGYSSLTSLRSAPFDKIKLDQTFVRGATESDSNSAAIMSAIFGLAQSLGMATVAEGVESRDELALVKDRGATQVQGYVFSAPVPNADVTARLESGAFAYEARGPEKFRAKRKSLFRRIGVIIDDYRYKAVLRNLSKTGAMIEGIAEVPVGTDCVIDLGGGQLVVATVRRSRGAKQGVEFETPLISDGSDGLCTRHRVSPYDIEAAGKPLSALPQDAYSLLFGDQASGGRGGKYVEVEVGPPRAITGTSSRNAA